MRKVFVAALVLTLLVFLLPVMAVRGEPLASGVEDEGTTKNGPKDNKPAVTDSSGTAGNAESQGDFEGAPEENPSEPVSGKNTGDDLPASADSMSANAASADVASAAGMLRSDEETQVRVRMGNKVVAMSLHYYLLGVLAAEMPASFPLEALKAQAVAARTVTLSRMEAADNGKGTDRDADVCIDPSHCKAYTDWTSVTSQWESIGRSEYGEKIIEAVSSTDGEVVCYHDKPIVAVFHAASGEYTENAKDVWGSEVPYLQSVKSPDGAEYMREVVLKADEFKSVFLDEYPKADLSGKPSSWFSETETSEAGGVLQIRIGGVALSGQEVRSLFGLASSHFTVKADSGKVTFQTAGYGHCVGMSQYGARALALKGRNYREIIAWYYTGVEIQKITDYGPI